jgi:hypothetical protein
MRGILTDALHRGDGASMGRGKDHGWRIVRGRRRGRISRADHGLVVVVRSLMRDSMPLIGGKVLTGKCVPTTVVVGGWYRPGLV